ncbi:MAG: RagB/SusD family nutrient uptake outer membrane protein [Prolixibacteraceae bacterium]|nr:RagB/SusD family nutrient uptake outer membrane protein [Prolixibacteraceae bacterium]
MKNIKVVPRKNLMIKSRLIIIVLITLSVTLSDCEDFLEKMPKGVTTIESFADEKGVNLLLIGAYATMDGSEFANQSMAAAGTPKNWAWNLASDDATKGSTAGDIIDLFHIERYETTSVNPWLEYRWKIGYDGIARANEVLKTLVIAEPRINDINKVTDIKAQAIFIRAFWHLQLQLTFWQIPYISEDVDPKTVKNDHVIWPEIEADLQFAIDNLADTYPGEPGRATKWAAMGIKAYVLLLQHKYSEAQVLLDNIINSGKFDLVENFRDNFSAVTENNIESLFETQQSVNDGSGTQSVHANMDSQLCNAYNRFLPVCCGFYQPTQDLVNAFKVDDNGLPLLGIDGPKFNETNLENDYNIPSNVEFIPTNHPVDPRLDQTIGRRGVDFLGWGIMTGAEWIRSQSFGGPYLQKKLMYSKDEEAIAQNPLYKRQHSINYRYLRYARILLWRAECAVEEGDLETARQLVNRVRRRAANPVNITMGKVLNYEYPSGPSDAVVDWTQPAANYLISEYPSFPSQEYAREAVRMEHRLEFAMEGQRFFDLVRWGIDYEVLTEFIEKDSEFRYAMLDAVYTKEKNTRWPLPQNQLDAQPGVLEQDPLWK